jgi:2-C-methyl-D-erythritol 4-phosphate cytidylyltransferase
MKIKFFNINKNDLENLASCKLKDDDIVLIYDTINYPFITKKMLSELIETAKEYGISVFGIKLRDTIKEVDENNFVIKTLDRRKFWEILYPRAVKYGLLKSCDNYEILKRSKVIEIKY